MRNASFTRRFALTAVSTIALGLLYVSASAQTPAEHPQFPPPRPEAQAPAVEANLKTFDVLDFDVFSNQKWDRLGESHAQDIIVTWPDGHETRGIGRHIEDLKALFVYAPDITIKAHPIRFGAGSWTAVTGVMTGTFTRPMPLPKPTARLCDKSSLLRIDDSWRWCRPIPARSPISSPPTSHTPTLTVPKTPGRRCCSLWVAAPCGTRRSLLRPATFGSSAQARL